MENHSDRPEVAAALAGRTGRSVRYSTTVREQMMYVAVPVEQGGKVLVIVRAAIPVTSIDSTLRSVQARIALIGLVIAVAAAQACQARAQARDIAVEIDAQASVIIRANPSLLERAVENLIDNAIKYSQRGGGVRVECRRGIPPGIDDIPPGIDTWRDDEAVISVSDKGSTFRIHLPAV